MLFSLKWAFPALVPSWLNQLNTTAEVPTHYFERVRLLWKRAVREKRRYLICRPRLWELELQVDAIRSIELDVHWFDWLVIGWLAIVGCLRTSGTFRLLLFTEYWRIREKLVRNDNFKYLEKKINICLQYKLHIQHVLANLEFWTASSCRCWHTVRAQDAGTVSVFTN